MSKDLAPYRRKELLNNAPSSAVPAVVAASGTNAGKRFLEFFAANIRNLHTRRAYYRAAQTFFHWCESWKIRNLADVQPVHVAAYVEERIAGRLGDCSMPTVKQELAAIRMLLDWLVIGQVIPMNPASVVRGPKYTVRKGKT